MSQTHIGNKPANEKICYECGKPFTSSVDWVEHCSITCQFALGQRSRPLGGALGLSGRNKVNNNADTKGQKVN